MQRVLGLLGRKGAGKDTAAQVLVSHGWVRLAFADPLYREVAETFGVAVEFLGNRDTKETPLPELALYRCRDQVFVAVVIAHAGLQLGVTDGRTIRAFLLKPRSPREIMQLWGTEYRRKVVRNDYWVEQVRHRIQTNPQTNFVVTDVRFPDEALMVTKDFGGELARVVRPSLAVLNDVAMQHASETVMNGYPVDVELLNDEGPNGMDALSRAVRLRFLDQVNESAAA